MKVPKQMFEGPPISIGTDPVHNSSLIRLMANRGVKQDDLQEFFDELLQAGMVEAHAGQYWLMPIGSRWKWK